jgi:anti-sigma-K factor RskA
MMSREQLSHLSGAYVLNALDDAERTAFAESLDDWDELRTEVIELSDTSVALGLSVPPVEPSPGLRERVLALAAVTPQWTPSPAPRAVASHRAPRRRRGMRPRATIRPTLRPALVLMAMSAAVLAAVLALGVGRMMAPPDPGGQVSFAELQRASDARRIPIAMPGGAGVEVIASDRLDAAAFAWEELPPLPGGRVYELWYLGDAPRAAGVIETPGGTGGELVLAGRLESGDRIAVTVEPAGGSARPTTKPVMVLDPA